MDLLSDDSSESGTSESEGIIEKAVRGGQEHHNTKAPLSHPRERARFNTPVNIVSSEDAHASLFQRTVPHKRGHWSGHVFAPCAIFMEESFSAKQSVLHFQRLLVKHGFSGTIVTQSKLHISLSRHFSLQLPFLDSFVSKLTRLMSTERTKRVSIDFSAPFILVNNEKTRSFWCSRVQPDSALQSLVSHVDTILKDYNQPKYYHPAIFHVSLASFAFDLTELSQTGQNGFDRDSGSESISGEEDLSVMVIDKVICQFGTTKTHTIHLRS